ncbi:MAG: hypothetical protein OXP69_22745 [Spirochaetaceae bacterium]|nr:hypothetical protein [Spirochaetaceae bacterium]
MRPSVGATARTATSAVLGNKAAARNELPALSGGGTHGAMRIANPMYDAVFKYLMDDDATARLLVALVRSSGP